ncbi:MAG: riboflavin biosynthesis protein RibF [Elusimicrobia bacterium]|nr:riboflavin biosynthesis protein RibF [Elusimicrobiota bacterium]
MGKPVVLTLGTFDGVHRGHQALLAKARARARALRGEVLAVAFDRPPRLFFHPEPSPALITTPEERALLLRRFGADHVERLAFGRPLARLSAVRFLRDYVRGRWKARECVVGFNFAFGRSREGDFATLQRLARRWNLRVHSVGPVAHRGQTVSSGLIRRCLRAGKTDDAAAFLGHSFALSGEVVRGRGWGRGLGYPTANLRVSPDKILPAGAFAVGVALPSGTRRGGMMNIGRRPTVLADGPQTVEVHVFDFLGRLDGQRLTVDLLGRLRPEKKFPSRADLIRQLREDERRARSRVGRSGWLA